MKNSAYEKELLSVSFDEDYDIKKSVNRINMLGTYMHIRKSIKTIQILVDFVLAAVLAFLLIQPVIAETIDIREQYSADIRGCREADYIIGYYLDYPSDREQYTGELTDVITKYGWESLYTASGTYYNDAFKTPDGDIYNYENPEIYAYNAYNKGFKGNSHIGYAACIMTSDGETVVRYQNCLMAIRDNSLLTNIDSDAEYLDYCKVILLDDSFSEDTIYNMINDGYIYSASNDFAMQGTYEDIIIYPSELVLNLLSDDRVTYAAKEDAVTGNQSIDTWISKGNVKLQAHIIDNQELHNEADKLLMDKFYNEAAGQLEMYFPAQIYESDNILTSYYFEYFMMDNGLISAYGGVYHPLETAMESLWTKLLVTVVIGALILTVFNRMIGSTKRQLNNLKKNSDKII